MSTPNFTEEELKFIKEAVVYFNRAPPRPSRPGEPQKMMALLHKLGYLHRLIRTNNTLEKFVWETEDGRVRLDPRTGKQL